MADPKTPEGGTGEDRAGRIHEVVDECIRRRATGEELSDEQIIADHADLMPELAEGLRRLDRIRRARLAAELPGSFAADGSHEPLPLPGIPGYQIVRGIGHGGQGIVYEALQQSTNRKVAIKVLLEGPYASASTRRRFEREIELVAHLKHPNIIAVFDSGTTPDGRLFYVMDYVRGVPVTQWVREKRLSLEEGLKLFTVICDTVSHAHQRGVIHRDLKPLNILVDAEGNLQILDFGLAKATAERAESLGTVTGQVLGTLPYMSPEQTEGHAELIDTRTDVYALGVILYEMLTGAHPYPVIGTIAEVIQHIAQTAPRSLARSWTSQAGISHSRRTRRPGRCPIDQEVETIVFKALAKERERRYQSAGELAEDVRHYLANEPIEAKRDSGLYVLKKMLQRYRAPVAVAAGFVVMLAIFAVAMTVSRNRALIAEKAEAAQRIQTEQQRDRALEAEKAARASQADSQAVLMFFLEKVLAAARPKGQEGGLGPGVTIRAALDAAEPSISSSFRDRPLVEAAIRFVMGGTYRFLGEYPAAVRQAEKSLRLRRMRLGPDDPETLRAMDHLAGMYELAGRLEEAVPLYEDTLRLMKARLGPDDPETLTTMNNLALAYHYADRIQEALAIHEEVLRLQKANLGPDDPETFQAMNNLAGAYHSAGRLKEALELDEETLRLRKMVLGPDHPDTLQSMNNLAGVYASAGRLQDALELHEQTLKLRRAKLGLDHPDTLQSMNNLAGAYRSAGRMQEALPLYEESLRLYRLKLGPEHPGTLSSMNNLAVAYDSAGRTQEAIQLFEETVKLRKSGSGLDHSETLRTMKNLAAAYRSAGRIEDAVQLEELLKVLKSKPPAVPSSQPAGASASRSAATRPSEAARLLDLSKHYNAAMTDAWQMPGGGDNTLASLAAGGQTLAGTKFDLRGVIQLGGLDLGKESRYPERCQPIVVGLKLSSVHFLHATSSPVTDGTVVGQYTIHYADGRQTELAIEYGRDLRSWVVSSDRQKSAERAVVAWTGRSGTQSVRLFKRTWQNPRPGVEIKSIEFRSAMAQSAPFLIAITGE